MQRSSEPRQLLSLSISIPVVLLAGILYLYIAWSVEPGNSPWAIFEFFEIPAVWAGLLVVNFASLTLQRRWRHSITGALVFKTILWNLILIFIAYCICLAYAISTIPPIPIELTP